MSEAVSQSDVAPKVYRGPDDKCCPCPYCSAIRSGALPIPAARSIWAKRTSGEWNPLRNADWGDE